MNDVSRNLWHGQTIRLTAITKEDLPALAHWYQDAGFLFVREGTFREFLLRDGKRYDMILYGLLRNEWEQRNLPAGDRATSQ